jgi:hypothetical protein
MLFFIQEAPLETTNYMIAGYTVIFIVMAIYLASLVIRNRNLNQDVEVLQELEEQETRQEQTRSAVKSSG